MRFYIVSAEKNKLYFELMHASTRVEEEKIKRFEKLIRQNPNSPLLVRLASIYLEIGDVEKAMTLCNRAIRKYPNYSTAHLLMAKCLIHIKSYSKAIDELNRVLEILPDSRFVVDLISKISSIRRKEKTEKKTSKSETIKEKISITEDKLPNFEVPEIVKGKLSIIGDREIKGNIVDWNFEIPKIEMKQKKEELKVETQTSYLDELIKRIEEGKSKQQNAKSKMNSEVSVNLKEENLTYEDISIVTPALAEILVKQGAYEEAIKVYRKLIEQRPSDKEKYEQEIKKIEEKLQK